MSAANIIAGILFGGIGFVAFMYGKKQSRLKPLLIGVALMAYPYFISNSIAVFAVGIVLTASLFLFRD